jgi:hypothetical protein
LHGGSTYCKDTKTVRMRWGGGGGNYDTQRQKIGQLMKVTCSGMMFIPRSVKVSQTVQKLLEGNETDISIRRCSTYIYLPT